MSKYALFVHDNPGFGGVDHITMQLVTGLQDRGWTIEHWYLRRRGLDVLRLASRAIRQRGVVVATQNFSAAYAAALLAVLCRRPWVMWVHGPVLDVLRMAGTGNAKRAWLRWLYRRTKVVVCSSVASQQSLLDFCGRDRSKALHAQVIRNTAAPAFLDAPRAARPWGHNLGFVGRVSVEKQPLIALQVLQALPSSYRLHVVGDGPLMDSLKAAGAKEIEQGRLILAGRQTITAQTYRQWDVTLLCSTYEGYPLAPLESLASGVPVACSPIPATTEMLGTHAPYMLASDHSPGALARTVEGLSQCVQAEVDGDIDKINRDHDPGQFVRQWDQHLTDCLRD
jgi:glycosyltransferase involved in cell wall biosynthesis